MSAAVSIFIAAHNRDQYVRAAIGSVQHQTYRDWKLIIWDDGSQRPAWPLASTWVG